MFIRKQISIRLGLTLTASFILSACGGGSENAHSALPAAFNLTQVTAEQEGAGQVSFIWQASAGANRYKICVLDQDNSCKVIGETTNQERILTIQNSDALAQPQYFIRAENSAGFTDSNQLSLSVTELTKAASVFVPDADQLKSIFAANVSMSADGKTVAVAAPFEAKGPGFFENDAGAVYIYQRDQAGYWTSQAKITASNQDGFDWFGIGISLSDDGKTLVVGASGEQSTQVDQPDRNDNDAVGAAYIFEADDKGKWQETAYLKSSSSLDVFDLFGGQVEISGDGQTLAIAAIGHDALSADDPLDNSRSNSGGVYIFQRAADRQWAQKQFLKATVPEEDAGFGYTLAMDYTGSHLAVGMPYSHPTYRYGQVYLYRKNETGLWQSQGALSGVNRPVAEFGSEIDMDSRGETLAISMPGMNGSATGVVRIYRRASQNVWELSEEIHDPELNMYSDFAQRGLSLSQDGQVIAIGATATEVADPLNPNQQLSKAGAAFIFRLDEQQAWQQSVILHAKESKSDAYYGHAIDLSEDGRALVIGASGINLRSPLSLQVNDNLNSSVVIY